MLLKAKKQLLSIKGKILLGLSGGPDSMCLCHLLKECGMDFQIAHVDHGIVKNSKKEKDRLQAYARDIDVIFHFCTLDAAEFSKSNLEEILRQKRLTFFKKIMKEGSLDVLLLGHQKDEKAETMIKRFFEGGSLFKLSGIKAISQYDKIKIIRPLLEVSKVRIIDYLKRERVSYYIDPSNFTGHNLRAKMRVNLIPKLEEEFGKNIVSSICDLGEQIEECSIYIEKKIVDMKKIEIKGVFGLFYPYLKDLDEYIYSLMIFNSLKEKGICVSRQQRHFIKTAIEKKISGKTIPFTSYHLFFDKSGVFLVGKNKIKIIPAILEENIHWLDFWKNGTTHPFIKEISLEKYTSYLERKKINEFHRKTHTPVWLRHLFPIPLTTISKKIKIKAQ